MTLNFPSQKTFLSRSDKWKSLGEYFGGFINYLFTFAESVSFSLEDRSKITSSREYNNS